MQIEEFHNRHKGETCLLVGNGLNLHRTPPTLFNYVSFGMNTIHKYDGGWRPTYYTTVDRRVMDEFGVEIYSKFQDIPKFIPRPNLDEWQGENFYRFYHRPGDIVIGGKNAGQRWSLSGDGIAWACVMHVAMQLAWYMGFTTMLMIGVEHNPEAIRDHFWGTDLESPLRQPLEHWLLGYSALVHSMGAGIRVLNISEGTYVPEDILPRADWRTYAS